MQCETINSHLKSILFTKILFSKFHFFQNFVLFYFILYFFLKNFCDEQCPISDSETVLSQKLSKCTMCTATAQPACTGRARVAVSQPAQRRVVGAQPTVSQRIGAVSQAQRLYRGRVPRAPLCALLRASQCTAARKRPYRGLPRDTMPNSLKPLLVTIKSGVLRYNSQQPPSLQYKSCHSSSCSHDTMFVS